MTITHRSKRNAWVVLLVCCGLAAGFGQPPAAYAEHREDNQSADFFAGHLRDSAGMPLPSSPDPTTELYRAGTVPLAQLTDVNGNPITWGQYNSATGDLSITHLPGGGTAMTAVMSGLIPGELYSFWAGYFDPFPQNRTAFGAMTANGLGTDHFMVAGNDGTFSIDLVQLEGPGTVEGNILSYAPDSPTGWDVGVALHFGDYPQKQDDPIIFLGPGDSEFWALATVTHFPVPEPSSIVPAILAGCAVVGRSRRRRNK